MDFPTYYKLGTVTVANGGTTLVFSGGTALLANVQKGDIFNCAGFSVRIEDPTDNTHVDLAYGWPGTALSAEADWEIEITAPGSALATTTRQMIEGLNKNLISIAQLNPADGDTLLWNDGDQVWDNTSLSGLLTTFGLTIGKTLTTVGAFDITLTATADTALILPTAGTLATLAGVEVLTNKTIAAGSNTITGLTTTNFAANVVDTDATLAANSDARLASQKATKAYVDALVQGLKWKTSVACVATTNITLSGEQTIDGVTTSSSRVLVTGQSTASQNGIYVSGSGAWTRSADADLGAELVNATTLVEGGTTYQYTQWTNTNTSITLGTTAISFTQINSATIIAGSNLSLSGSTLNVVASPSFTDVTLSGVLHTADGATWDNTGIASLAKLGIGMMATNIVDITQNQNGVSTISILNNNAGTGAASKLRLNNGTYVTEMVMHGTGFATSNSDIQNAARLYTNAPGGFVWEASNAAGAHYWYAGNNTTERMRLTAAGALLINATALAGTEKLRVNGAGRFDGDLTVVNNLSVGGQALSGATFASPTVCVGTGSPHAAGYALTVASGLHTFLGADLQILGNLDVGNGTGFFGNPITIVGFGQQIDLAATGLNFHDGANPSLGQCLIQAAGTGGVVLSAGATSWAANSKRALKHKFQPFPDPYDIIMGHEIELGLYKNDPEDRTQLRPFMFAEDARRVYPYGLSYTPARDWTDPKTQIVHHIPAHEGLWLDHYVPVLMAFAQSQYNANNDFDARLKALEAKQ